MKRSGLPPAKIAEVAGLDQSYVYYVRRGSRLPELDASRALDEAVGAGGLLVAFRLQCDRLSEAMSSEAPSWSEVSTVGPWTFSVDERGCLVVENVVDGSATVLAAPASTGGEHIGEQVEKTDGR